MFVSQILVEQNVVDMYQESSCSQSVVGRLGQAARMMEQVQNMRTLYSQILESLTSSSEDDLQKWNFIEKLEMMPVASDSWWLWCFLLKSQQHSLLELSHISSWTWVIDIDCNMEPGYLVNPFNPHCVHFSTSKASCCFLCIIKQNKTWIIDVSHKVPILIERTLAHTSCWQLTVSPSNNHPKLPWRAESSSVGCVMQTITAKVYCIGLTETYCANLASRSSEEPWGSVAQPGSVVSGSFHPPASTFYRFNNLGWICSIKGCSEAVTINHQAYWNCFFFYK